MVIVRRYLFFKVSQGQYQHPKNWHTIGKKESQYDVVVYSLTCAQGQKQRPKKIDLQANEDKAFCHRCFVTIPAQCTRNHKTDLQ